MTSVSPDEDEEGHVQIDGVRTKVESEKVIVKVGVKKPETGNGGHEVKIKTDFGLANDTEDDYGQFNSFVYFRLSLESSF